MSSFSVGDRVVFDLKQRTNPKFDPGIGLVTNVTEKRVVVEWIKFKGLRHSKPSPYKASKLIKLEGNES
jgi:hypothetical protein